jgi:response regulator RpfG family c-di-GMP phosphodiesterase
MKEDAMSAHGLIVLADGDWVSRRAFMEACGPRFHVTAVDTAEEAIARARREPVAVMVFDAGLPEMACNGPLAAAREASPATLRMVAADTHGLPGWHRAVVQGLVVDCVVKPWRDQALGEALAWAVEAYGAGGEASEGRYRVLEQRRLAALHGLGATLVQELGDPVSVLRYNSERVRQFATARESLELLLTIAGGLLPATHRTLLTDLTEEIADIGDDMASACDELRALVDAVRRRACATPGGAGACDETLLLT